MSKSTYTSYCDSLNKAIFQRKRSYYKQRFSCCSNHSKETSKQINKVLKPNTPENELMMCHNNQTLNDPADTAECFIEFFYDIPTKITCAYVNRIENSFVHFLIAESDVVGAFTKLKSKKGAIDEVQYFLLKNVLMPFHQ